MAVLINAENLHLSFGVKTVLDGVSVAVHSGDRIGVVGLNGGGKSSLLRILAGIDDPDSGRVARQTDLRLATVNQEANLDPQETVLETIINPLGVATYEWASNATIRNVLGGLGIVELGLDRPVSALSGGERRRVMLARALVQQSDVLILDEPTNHLDVEGVQWLADYVRSLKSALVVVTHDRWFLDAVATTTWEVHDGTVDVYQGGFNDWMFARAERARQADAIEQRRQNLARKELAWLRRGAPARTSKPRYRIEAAEALIKNVPPPRDSVELMAFAKQRQGRVVVELEDATVTTPDGRVLLEDLTWRLAPGERLGLVGVNGSGKTTLLRTLAGAYELSAGRRIAGRTLRLGWLRQELDDLDGQMRLLDAVSQVAAYVQWGKKELTASQVAERLGFSAKRQRTPIKDLSGGERRRLQLTRVLMAEPNLLLLDEPTNDLDVDTLQELEDLLDSWPGTLVVISHDRYLIERVCDNTYALMGDGKLRHLPGGIEEYLQLRRTLKASGPRGALNLGGANAPADAPAAASVSAKPQLDAATQRALQKELAALERKITKLTSREAELEEEMAALGTDLAALNARAAEHAAVRAQREQLELEWMERAEELS